jgi:hypothetical protein
MRYEYHIDAMFSSAFIPHTSYFDSEVLCLILA